MHRFYIKEKLKNNTEITPSKNLHHYLKRVVRIKKEEEIRIFNGMYEHRAFFDGVTLKVMEMTRTKEEKDKELILFQPRLLNQKLSLVIQKATEIGVNKIFLFKSERIKGKNTDRDLKKLERFNKIAQESAEQCFRIDIPIIEYIDFNQIIPDKKQRYFVGSINGDNKLSNLIKDKQAKSLGLIIGPEGGFSEKEMNLINSRGIISVSFGTNILRSETASIYGLSVMKEKL